MASMFDVTSDNTTVRVGAIVQLKGGVYYQTKHGRTFNVNTSGDNIVTKIEGDVIHMKDRFFDENVSSAKIGDLVLTDHGSIEWSW